MEKQSTASISITSSNWAVAQITYVCISPLVTYVTDVLKTKHVRYFIHLITTISFRTTCFVSVNE